MYLGKTGSAGGRWFSTAAKELESWGERSKMVAINLVCFYKEGTAQKPVIPNKRAPV